MSNELSPTDAQIARAEEAIEKAWHYLYGDGADPQTGQGFATLAVAHAVLAVAERRSFRGW